MSQDAEQSVAGKRSAVPPPTRATACADEIRKRILEGEYASGMQLRQDALAEQLGVSRIPVREALVQLEAEGLVKLRPHRGAIVTSFAAGEVQELYEFRALLEPRLLEKSAPLLSKQEFQQLHAILKEYSEELRSTHIIRWGELNVQLHSLLYSHANSPRMEATALQLLQGTDRFTRMHIFYTGGVERAEREHEMIVNLCEHGEISAASELLRRHIVRAGEDLARHIGEHKSSSPPE